LAILATVIVVRVGWLMLYSMFIGAKRQGRREQSPFILTAKSAFTVGWCGMRGIVTLATALALPYGEAGGPFPYRELLIAAAFTVVLGTLVPQGLTLGALLRRFKLSDDGMVAREEVFARQETAVAALKTLEGETRPEAAILRKEYNFRLREDVPPEDTLKPHTFGRLRLRAIHAERETLQRLRRSQKIGDAAFQTVQEELDWAEGHAVHRRRAFAAEAPPDGDDAVRT
jgi:CPA1 family monovalent cation:H+ antiporter